MLLLLSVKFGTSSRRRVFDRWSLGSDRKSFGEERAIVKVWSRIFIDTSVNFDVHCRFRTKKKCAECTGWIARDVWLTIDQGEWHFCKRNLAYYYTLLLRTYHIWPGIFIGTLILLVKNSRHSRVHFSAAERQEVHLTRAPNGTLVELQTCDTHIFVSLVVIPRWLVFLVVSFGIDGEHHRPSGA